MIRISISRGDGLAFPADVLALKYAMQSHGVDLQVVRRLSGSGIALSDHGKDLSNLGSHPDGHF